MARQKCHRPPYKDKYPSLLEAELQRNRIVLKAKGKRGRKWQRLPIRSYQCEFCHSWHMTEQPKKSGVESGD